MASEVDAQARKPGGPAREEPTKEERDRVPELKALAHQASMLGAENDLLLEAAALIQQAQSKIDAAMALRQERKVDSSRPGRQPADEIVALENLEQSAIAFVRKKLTVNGSIEPGVDEWLRAWAADSLAYSEPVNRLVRSARCLLRFVEDIVRSEVRMAVIHEDVPLPGETPEQILDRLMATELGLGGVLAQRARNPSEDLLAAGMKQAKRREQKVGAALAIPESAFAEGFNRSGAKATADELSLLDEIVRKSVAFAATVPGLDAQVVRASHTVLAPQADANPEVNGVR